MSKRFFLLLLLCVASVWASQPKEHSVRVLWGYASEKDLGTILVGDFTPHPLDLTTLSVDGGYLLRKNLFDVPIDLYVKGGVSYFNEDEFKDRYEALVYLKLFWNIDVYSQRFRLGFGEGVSLVNDYLETEYKEAAAEGDEVSKFLNYLDISLDVDVGRVFYSKTFEDVYVGYVLKHRSGVFGLYNGVHGGSNYNSFYLEVNF